ncbi:AAA family ATPase [Nonomuraea rosea]|uniref:nucleotide-binding protein n=1 Tax=Nonomuraea rosea TaxID=638574 RepID=UPI0031EFBD7B
MDPDLTRTIRFPPPNRSSGAPAAEKPPPPPPSGLWWQQDRSGSEPPASAPAAGHFEMWSPPTADPWPSPGDQPDEDQGVWHSGEPEPDTAPVQSPAHGPAQKPAQGPAQGPGQGPVLPEPTAAAAPPPRPVRVFPPPGQPPAATPLPPEKRAPWEQPSAPPPQQRQARPAPMSAPVPDPAATGTPAHGQATPRMPAHGQAHGQAAPHVQASEPGAAYPDPSAAGAADGSPGAAMSSESLRPERLLRTRRRPPSGGWRKLVYTLSGGLIRPQDSKAERHRHELIERIRRPVAAGHFRIAVMSLKGGVGKTTTTIGLGSTLAHQRGDRVIAVDANPDRGTLSEKLRLESPATVRHLLNDRGGIWRYADVRSYTSQAPSRLEVLASDRDPAISEAFNDDDYRAVAQILEQFYSISITDCGTGMLHSAMSAILAMADQIVLVSPVTVDGARSASATLDWLQAHGHQTLAKDAVVVLSAVKNTRRNPVNLEELKGHFSKRCRAVIGIPFDPHLEQGSEVDLDLLRTSTRDTYLEVGATIADRFSQRAGA